MLWVSFQNLYYRPRAIVFTIKMHQTTTVLFTARNFFWSKNTLHGKDITKTCKSWQLTVQRPINWYVRGIVARQESEIGIVKGVLLVGKTTMDEHGQPRSCIHEPWLHSLSLGSWHPKNSPWKITHFPSLKLAEKAPENRSKPIAPKGKPPCLPCPPFYGWWV